jgi:hypothetical protein
LGPGRIRPELVDEAERWQREVGLWAVPPRYLEALAERSGISVRSLRAKRRCQRRQRAASLSVAA